jgi:hypothetical protein
MSQSEPLRPPKIIAIKEGQVFSACQTCSFIPGAAQVAEGHFGNSIEPSTAHRQNVAGLIVGAVENGPGLDA